MQRAHKIRLNPTSEQERYLRNACGMARFAFNWGLAEWQRQYEIGEKPSVYKLKKQLNAIKHQEFPWMYKVTKCAVETGFRNLDIAFKNFFRRCKSGDTKKGYPNFKSKKRSRLSFRMDRPRVSTNSRWLKLEKLDEPINMAEELRFNGEIKSVTISEDTGCWYAAINVEVIPPKHEHPREAIGVDLGIKTLAVLSDGREFENQKFLRSELRKLRRFSHELSRRQEGSSRWNQTKTKLVRFHRYIANRRMDYQHKMTTKIASMYRVIGIENLNIAEMLRNRKLALSVADAGFGKIRQQLRYKAEWYGSKLVEVDRFFPSSRLCQFCGYINSNLTLADRTWTCNCSAVLDRDQNAALNIEGQALTILGRRGGFTESLNGCGQDVRPSGAILGEASKNGRVHRPSISAVV